MGSPLSTLSGLSPFFHYVSQTRNCVGIFDTNQKQYIGGDRLRIDNVHLFYTLSVLREN